jgi:acetyltransferase-like isoleucine patch superfamily enzyme
VFSLYRFSRQIVGKCFRQLFFVTGRLYCRMKGVEFGKNLQTYGLPLIYKHRDATIVLGDNVVLTSWSRFNLAGVNHKVILAAPNKQSHIYIGSDSGLSGAVLHSNSSITIGHHVGIGANVRIFDNDFHSINYLDRISNVPEKILTQPILLEDNVWIGANAIILKGVNIGRGAIVGAGSVVTKDIQAFSLWAGNPARFIKNLVS